MEHITTKVKNFIINIFMKILLSPDISILQVKFYGGVHLIVLKVQSLSWPQAFNKDSSFQAKRDKQIKTNGFTAMQPF